MKIIGLDLDADAIGRFKSLVGELPHDVILRTVGFQDMDKILDELNMTHVDRVLLDLGISSFQLEVAGRGFSFLKDEPLLMTMKKPARPHDSSGAGGDHRRIYFNRSRYSEYLGEENTC